MTDTPFDTSKIIAEVAHKHGLTVARIIEPRSNKNGRSDHAAADARAESAYRIRTERKLSFPQIARILNYRDHTSVMDAVRKVHRHIKSGKTWPDGYRSEKRPHSKAEVKKIKAVPISVIRRFNLEMQRVARINEVWRCQGVEANASVIRDGDYFHVRSAIPLVRISQ